MRLTMDGEEGVPAERAADEQDGGRDPHRQLLTDETVEEAGNDAAD